MKLLIIWAAILIFCTVNMFPQERKDPREIAASALETFKKMINEQNFRAMGFESPDEISRAQLSNPMMVYNVPLDRLKEYRGGSNPMEMLVDEQKYIYPVSVNESVRSSISVSRTKEQWKPTNFGSPNYTKMLAKYQMENSIVVNVPALNLSFVGMRQDSRLTLVPIMDFEEFGFSAGERMRAEEVFEKISEAAREHDGLPR